MEDINELNEFEYNGYYIQYNKFNVLKIFTKQRNLSAELMQIWTYNGFNNYVHHLYDFPDYQKAIKNIIIEICELAKGVRQVNGELSCYIASHIFSALSPYSNFLRIFHFHLNALTFWRYILKIIKEWEAEKPENEIHKGTIYGFIAEVNMSLGDYEIAFTYMHRAVREDFNIEKYIPGYGRIAPGYKIITLRPSQDHWMWGYVKQIRDMLSIDINDFNTIFTQYSPFEISNFDSLFVENPFFDKDEFENLKITASYYIWSTYYYSWKVDRAEKSSTFDNLNRLPKLFGSCVTIETLANTLLGKKRTLLERADLLYTFIGGSNNYKKVLYPKVKDKDEKIDVILKNLLNYKSNDFDGIKIDEIDRCILIYSLIRNFTAHNVKSIESIGESFFNISQSLLFLLIVFLIELKKQGKIS